MKECTKCKVTKDEAEFSTWENSRTGTTAISSRCKPCVAEYSRSRYSRKKDELSIQSKEYYEKHKEHIKATARAYYAGNKDHVKNVVADYRAANQESVKARLKAWREANPERYRAAQTAWADRNRDKIQATGKAHYSKVKATRAEKWQAMRMMVMDHYGGQRCACCGESTYSFLTIDHINNDGANHRKNIGRHFYRWIIKNNYPPGFQVLCMNCNFGKHQNGGVCPHEHLKAQRLGETRTLQAIGSGSAQHPSQVDEDIVCSA